LGSALVGKYLGELGFSDDAVMWMNQQDAAHLNFLSPEVSRRLGIDMTIFGSDRQLSKRIAGARILETGQGAALARPSGPEPELPSPSDCQHLWEERNAIFKAAGYCFSTSRAIATFDNEGCQYARQEDVPLSGADRSRVTQIRLVEVANGCK
jgi:hypothetical protein